MSKTELNTSVATKQWYENGGEKKIEEYFLDPDRMFSSYTGKLSGVYGAYVVTPEGKEILMYIGETGKEKRRFIDRLTEHARFWIENPEHYTGVKRAELENGYKYLVRMLEMEDNDTKRYAKEQELCEIMKPYMQSGVYPKYESKYRGFDLAIFPTYRRRAFLIARDGKVTQSYVEDLIEGRYEYVLLERKILR